MNINPPPNFKVRSVIPEEALTILYGVLKTHYGAVKAFPDADREIIAAAAVLDVIALSGCFYK